MSEWRKRGRYELEGAVSTLAKELCSSISAFSYDMMIGAKSTDNGSGSDSEV